MMLSFLLATVCEDDREKIEYLYKTFHDDMIRFARSRLKRAGASDISSDAEDAVQNSFVKIIKYIDAVDFSQKDKKLKSYIFTITANEVTNILRVQHDEEDIEKYSAVIAEEDLFAHLKINERYEEVVAAIRKLDERYSMTLMLKYSSELDVREIAALLGVSEKTVYTRLERGKRMLLLMLGEGDGDVLR